jgi:hypothetical protein
MAWEIDPDFALHSRLSFGRRKVLWLTLAAATSVVALFVVPNVRLQGLFGIVGATLIGIAPPYGALHVISLERGHLLDLRRLAGRPSLGWMLASIFGTSWLLLALAVPLLLASPDLGFGVIPSLATLWVGMTVALLLLGAPGLQDVDGRLLLAVVLLIAFATTVVGWRARMHPVMFLAGSAAAVAAALPAALRQMRRRRSLRVRTVRNPFGRVVRLSRSQRPEFARSVLMAGPSVLAAGFIGLLTAVGLGMRVWNEWPRIDPSRWVQPLGMMAYTALLIAVIGCSTQGRRERASGGVDRIRLTSQRPWPVVFQMAAGDALPLLLVSIMCIGVIWPASPYSPAVRAWPAVAALAILTGLAEGLQGRKLGTYVLPLAAICWFWYWQGVSWWPLLLAAFLPAAAAAACFAGPTSRSVKS